MMWFSPTGSNDGFREMLAGVQWFFSHVYVFAFYGAALWCSLRLGLRFGSPNREERDTLRWDG